MARNFLKMKKFGRPEDLTCKHVVDPINLFRVYIQVDKIQQTRISYIEINKKN